MCQLPCRDTSLVYDSDPAVLDSLIGLEGLPIACLISYGASPRITYPKTGFPTLLHVPQKMDAVENISSYSYPGQSPHFVLPQTSDYDARSASLAHSRSLVFLRNWLGGPVFDLEAIWDRHCYFEFEIRSVAKTMATMVVCYSFPIEIITRITTLIIARTLCQSCSNGMSMIVLRD